MNLRASWKAIGAFFAYIITVIAENLGIQLEDPTWLSELITAVVIAAVVYWIPQGKDKRPRPEPQQGASKDPEQQ